MKKLVCIVSTLSILITSVFPAMSVLAEDVQETQNQPHEQYIVQVADYATADKIDDTYSADYVSDNLYNVSLTSLQAKRLERDMNVEAIEKNIILNAASDDSDNDSKIYEQWYLDATGVKDAKKSDSTVTVEIIDSGVDYSDKYTICNSVNLVEEDKNESPLFQDSTGHGSAIAGVIASTNDDDVFNGINPNVELYSAKVMDSNNQATLSRVIEAIYLGIENDVDIINMSFGTTYNSAFLHQAVKDAYDSGVLLIAAAGNDKHTEANYPANYPEVISVGSVDLNGEISDNSCIDGVDVFAPGEKITTLDFLDSFTSISGTSIATAQVTGISSLLLARDKTKSNEFIRQLICDTANFHKNLDGTDVGIVNYKSAIDSYNDYKIDDKNIDYSCVDNFDYTKLDEIKVNALWGNSSSSEGHYDLANKAADYASFSGNAPSILRHACSTLDQYNCEKGKTGTPVGGPHGTGNYVINLRFLYLASRRIYDYGYDSKEYKNLVKEFEKSKYWSETWGREKDFDRNRFKAILIQIEYFVKTNKEYPLLPSEIRNKFNTYSQETKNRYLGIMIFGMAIHLAGDMFAHKTIVPKYTIKGVNSSNNSTNSDGQDMFGTKYFNKSSSFTDNDSTRKIIKYWCFHDGQKDKYSGKDIDIAYWQHCQLGVALQCVEFRDINMFLSSKSNPFEDKALFCEERYKAAMLACKRIAKRFKENGSFYTKLFYPKYYNSSAASNKPFETVKLNNFKNYTVAADLATAGDDLDKSDWAINSNSTLV